MAKDRYHNPNIFKDLTETFDAMNLPLSHMFHDGDGFSLSNLKDLFKELPFQSIVFRPNYYTILFVKDAYADYTTDDITFRMEPGTIFLLIRGISVLLYGMKLQMYILLHLMKAF